MEKGVNVCEICKKILFYSENTKLLFELNYLGTFLDIDKIRSYKDDNTPTNTSTLNPGIRLNDISLKVGVIF